MKVRKVPGGTKEKPQLVPSMYSERMVGCICKCSTSVHLRSKARSKFSPSKAVVES